MRYCAESDRETVADRKRRERRYREREKRERIEAAAPDLYAACKDFVNTAAVLMAIQILEEDSSKEKKNFNKGIAIVLRALQDKAKAALAKVDGKDK